MSATFLKHFNSITDPRIERCKKHELIDIILLAISAVLSGAEGWVDVEDFGHLKLDWLKKYGTFNAGILKHDTIARVICRLKADEIERAFQSWVASLVETTGALTAGKHQLKWVYKQINITNVARAVLDNILLPIVKDSDFDEIDDTWEYLYFDDLNHDMSLDSEFSMPLKSMIAGTKVTVVDENSCDITIDMNFVVKGGLLGRLMGLVLVKPMMKSVTKKLLNGLAYHAATEKLVANKLPSQQALSAAFNH